MNDDEVLFSPKTVAEKQEDFAATSMRIIVKQMGGDPRDIEGSPDWYWFNSRYPVSGVWVCSARVFRFDIADLLFRPSKHAIIAAFREQVADAPAEMRESVLMLFNVYEWGRMFITNTDYPDLTALRVVIRNETFYSSPLGDFFKRYNSNG